MLGRMLDLDSPFWRAIGKLADIVWLNVLMVLCSLPVVTIGASLTALYDCARRILADTGDSTTAMFFRSFASNWRQASLLWLVAGGVGALLVAFWFFVRLPEMFVLQLALSLVYLLVFPFLWALQARFENPPGRTLVNAVLLAFARLPLSLAILALDAGLIALTVVVATQLPQVVIVIVLFGYPLLAFVNTPLLERALRPLLEAAGAPPEDPTDPWAVRPPVA